MALIKIKFDKDKADKPIKKIELGSKGAKQKQVKPNIEKKKPVKKAKKTDFVIDWENQLGFAGNPFKENVLEPADKYIAGYEKEKNKINLFIINNENFGIVTGDEGIGKTTVIKWLYSQLKEHQDKLMPCFFDGKLLAQEFIFLKTIVNPLLTFYEIKIKKLNKDIDIERNLSLLKSKISQKKLVLIIDDVTVMPDRVLLLIKRMYSIMQLQIIVSCNNQFAQKLRSMEWLDDKLKMQLKGLDIPEAELMIKKRVEAFGGEGIFPFDTNYIKKICKEADNNPKNILILCQKYAKELAVEHIERKQKQIEEKKEDYIEQQHEAKEEKEAVEKDETHPEIPVLREIPKKTDYEIKFIDRAAEAISLDDLKAKEKKDYVIKPVEKKKR